MKFKTGGAMIIPNLIQPIPLKTEREPLGLLLVNEGFPTPRKVLANYHDKKWQEKRHFKPIQSKVSHSTQKVFDCPDLRDQIIHPASHVPIWMPYINLRKKIERAAQECTICKKKELFFLDESATYPSRLQTTVICDPKTPLGIITSGRKKQLEIAAFKGQAEMVKDPLCAPFSATKKICPVHNQDTGICATIALSNLITP